MSEMDLVGKTSTNDKRRVVVDGDPEWWTLWKNRLERAPFSGKTRFAFIRLMEVDEKNQEFEARIRIDCEVDTSVHGSAERRSLGLGKHTNYGSEIREKGDPNNKFKDAWLEEFNPKLVIMNLKRTDFPASKWIRRSGGVATYSMEVTGRFSVPVKFSTYPIDTHKLTVQVTSDWSDEYFKLEPNKTQNQFTLKDQFEIVREYRLSPGVMTESTKNKSSKGLTYSQVDASVLIRRRAFFTFLMIVLRPFAVTTLGFSVFALRPSEDAQSNAAILSNRITIVLVLLLASAVEPRRSYTTFTFTDYYTLLAFLTLIGISFESVIVLSDAIVNLGQEMRNADFIGAVILAVLWAATNVGLVMFSGFLHIQAERKIAEWDRSAPPDLSNPEVRVVVDGR